MYMHRNKASKQASKLFRASENKTMTILTHIVDGFRFPCTFVSHQSGQNDAAGNNCHRHCSYDTHQSSFPFAFFVMVGSGSLLCMQTGPLPVLLLNTIAANSW